MATAAPLLGMTTVSLAGLGLTAAAFFLALREGRLARPRSPRAGLSLAAALVALVFGAIIAGWS